MKNFTLSLVLALSFLGAFNAQASICENNVVHTELHTLHAKLKLTESQFVKLRGLELTRIQEIKEAQVIATGVKLDLFIADINARYEDGVFQLLNSTQQKLYIAIKESNPVQ